jgi:hypothetical protein
MLVTRQVSLSSKPVKAIWRTAAKNDVRDAILPNNKMQKAGAEGYGNGKASARF